MENGARALVMAGGILLAILIIGALMLMFSNLSTFKDQDDKSKLDAQIAQFNNQFEPFNKKGLTLMELKSVYNKIESNNAKFPEYTIDHNIDEDLINGVDTDGDGVREYDVFNDFIDDFHKVSESQKINRKFNCTGLKYENDRRKN